MNQQQILNIQQGEKMKGQNKLVAVVKESGLIQESKIKELMASFTNYFQEAQELAKGAREIVVTDESQTELMQRAREKRLELKFVRTETEKTRKELKEQSLREGRAIDGVANVIKALIVPVEQHLEKQEKFAEIKEQERINKRYEKRVEELSKYMQDIPLGSLLNMEEEVYEKLLDGAKRAFEAEKKAEAEVERERVEREKQEREEQERIRKENAKLKAEAEAREKQLAKEREEQEKKLEAERLIQQKKLEIERKKKEAVELKLKEEKEAREKKEREAKELEEARTRAEEEEKRRTLLAPDKEKLNKLAMEIDNISLPSVSSKEAGDLVNEVSDRLTKISQFLRVNAKKL